MTTIAIKSNPRLWEKIKNRIKRGSKGGPPGKWSARKAQLSVKLYKQSGGKYKGSKSSSNSLTKWSKEEWGYIKGSNRYLPKIVRSHLSSKEQSIENKRKGSKRGKWIPYSKSVNEKMKKYHIY
jgi:hypothetical protein